MRRRDNVDFGEEAHGVLRTRDIAVTKVANISKLKPFVKVVK